MNFKTALTAIFVALLALTCTAGATEITYDLSGIPDSPAAGTQYVVPVTVSGDVTGYKLTVSYDDSAAEVSFSDTEGATTGGRPGSKKIVSTDGTPKTFNLLITPLSNATITLNSELAGDIPCTTHDEIKFVFEGLSGSFNLTPTGGKIDWGAESVEIVDGKASIPVVMTGADRVSGITVILKNVSGANVSLNRTGSALFRSGTATRLNYYSSNGFTNSGTVSLYTIDITNISEGAVVSFDLDYKVSAAGRYATIEYTASNPVSVRFTAPVRPPKAFTVTYSGAEYVPDAAIVEAGAEYIISDDRAVSPGRIFRGWVAGSEEYAPGDRITVNGNITLKAEWYTPAVEPTGASVVGLYKALHGENPDQYQDYDMNGDGHVNIIDLVLMAQYVADSVAVLV